MAEVEVASHKEGAAIGGRCCESAAGGTAVELGYGLRNLVKQLSGHEIHYAFGICRLRRKHRIEFVVLRVVEFVEPSSAVIKIFH